jgi:hypothetical protein
MTAIDLLEKYHEFFAAIAVFVVAMGILWAFRYS